MQILGLQEIFNGPYFCPSQDPKLVRRRRGGPGADDRGDAGHRDASTRWSIVVPVYEREQAGVYYNTAAVIDADGTYLGKYRKTHIPHTNGFWEKYFFKPGNLGLPRLPDALRARWASTSATTVTSPRARGARAQRRGDRLQPVGDRRGALAVPLEARAAGARRGQRVLRRGEQPRRHRGALEHRQVLRHELRRRPARAIPRDRERGQGRARGRDVATSR